MKKLFLTSLFVFSIVLLSVPSHALFMRNFFSLTGEVSGSVDNATCASLGDGTDDGSGIVINDGEPTYFYFFDRSATFATSSPDYIRCKNYTTSGVWIRQELLLTPVDADEADTDYYVVLVDGATGSQATETEGGLLYNPSKQRFNPGTTPGLNFQDESAATAGEIIITNDAITAGQASTYIVKVDEDGAEDVEYYKANGSTETFDVAKPIIAIKGSGKPYENIEANNQTETIDSTICEYTYYIIDATGPEDTITFALPADPECSSGYAKRFCFWYRAEDTTSSELVFLDPNGTDQLVLPNSAVLAAGFMIKNSDTDKGDRICIEGRDSGGDYWMVTDLLGDWVTNGS